MNPSNASWRGREPLGATQGAAGGDIYFAYLRFQADPPKENDLVDCLVEPHQGGRGQAPPPPGHRCMFRALERPSGSNEGVIPR